MKKKLAKIATAIRNSRKLKFLAIAGMVWIALLVGFVGASRMKPKPKTVVIVDHAQFSVRTKHRVRQHQSHSRGTTPADASVSTNPCATPELRSQETTGTSPVTSLPAQRHNEETLNAPMGLADDQQREYRPRPEIPIVPNITNNRLPAVVWVSAVRPSNSRPYAKVVPSYEANMAISLAAQSKSDSRFTTFRKPVEIGKQASGSGFKPFRP